jgi:nicotinamidase-related amidase
VRASPGPGAGRGRLRAALLVVDLINAFDYDGGAALLRRTRPIAPRVLRLREAFTRARSPVIYCNDNFGRWRSDFRDAVRSAAAPGAAASDIVALLRPRPRDYFVLKPAHSAFFGTPLDLLLKHMRLRHVVLAGIAGDGCIAATAIDAHMRDYRVTVVRDATASQSEARQRRALMQLRDNADAELVTTAALVRALGYLRTRR